MVTICGITGGIGATVIYQIINGENTKRGNTTEKQSGSNGASTHNRRVVKWLSRNTDTVVFRVRISTCLQFISGQNSIKNIVLATYKNADVPMEAYIFYTRSGC